jgi:hypothetical protein
LIEAWNGSTWTIEDAPTLAGSSNTRLNGVSCSSPTACTAVGWFSGTSTNGSNDPFAEVWNGSTWAFQTPSVDGVGGQLNSVSCPAPGSCVAVGSAETNGGNPPLIETAAGPNWTATIPPGLPQASLAGVSCSAKDACLAVGNSTEGETAMVALGWDGSAWTAQDVPAPSGATSGQLDAVSCPSGASCVAAGSFTTSLSSSQPVIEDDS